MIPDTKGTLYFFWKINFSFSVKKKKLIKVNEIFIYNIINSDLIF